MTDEFNPTKSVERLLDEAATAFRKALSSRGLATGTVNREWMQPGNCASFS